MRKRRLALDLQDRYGVSERRACRLIKLSRTVNRYVAHRADQSALRQRIKEIAAVRVRYGFRRIHVLLRREGWHVNHKRVHRLYREEGLNLRVLKSRRKLVSQGRKDLKAVDKVNERWAMDFVSDALYDGRRIRILTIIDTFSRENLWLLVEKSISGAQVVDALDKWAYENKVALEYSRPGKPTDNAHIESFNGRFREECLSRVTGFCLWITPGKNRVLPEGL